MRMRAIALVGLLSVFASFCGSEQALASAKKHAGCRGHKSSCCSNMHCCRMKTCNDAGAVLWKKGNCKTELELMKKAGMCHLLCGKGPITLFCPSDEAYGRLGKARVEELKNDPAKLAAVMKYHLLNRKIMAADIKAGGALVTSEGSALMTNVKDGKAELDGCLVVESDILCANGVVHILDEVPLPERGK